MCGFNFNQGEQECGRGRELLALFDGNAYVVLPGQGFGVSPDYPTCTASMEIDPPSIPSTGKVSGSSAFLLPIT